MLSPALGMKYGVLIQHWTVCPLVNANRVPRQEECICLDSKHLFMDLKIIRFPFSPHQANLILSGRSCHRQHHFILRHAQHSVVLNQSSAAWGQTRTEGMKKAQLCTAAAFLALEHPRQSAQKAQSWLCIFWPWSLALKLIGIIQSSHPYPWGVGLKIHVMWVWKLFLLIGSIWKCSSPLVLKGVIFLWMLRRWLIKFRKH